MLAEEQGEVIALFLLEEVLLADQRSLLKHQQNWLEFRTINVRY